MSMFFNKKKEGSSSGDKKQKSATFATVPVEPPVVSVTATVDPDADTVAAANTSEEKDTKRSRTASKLKRTEDELAKARETIAHEKSAKRKLYSSLVKLAQELKKTREESKALIEASNYANRNWYEGGMWREPQLLPGIESRRTHVPNRDSRGGFGEAVSLSDLFLDVVVVTAFTRVGVAVSDRGTVDPPVLAYFAVFWLIWQKEASYATRFDTTDLSAQVETLLTCFAVLFGSLSSTEPFQSEDATRIMLVAAFVAILHFLLHLRVAFWYRDALPGTVGEDARKYALFTMTMTSAEAIVWLVGAFALPTENPYRWAIFLVGIILGFRIPRSFLANDFHAAKSKRGVLFILLLGFLLQSIVVVASPFFDYQTPSAEQYAFLGASCFVLFCIKLLYVDDTYSIDAKDHALLVNRTAGFFFYIGQFCLLLSTTVLGSGLDLLTHSYLAATAALPANAKDLVCAGFAAVILSIAFIKSMHLRRVPVNPKHERLFFVAYGLQLLVIIAIAFITLWMCFYENGYLSYLTLNEIEMMFVLSGFALVLVLMSWLDEAVELSIYGDSTESREYRVHPFGLWGCIKPEVERPASVIPDAPGSKDSRLAQLSPLLGESVANMASLRSLRYSAIMREGEEGGAQEV